VYLGLHVEYHLFLLHFNEICFFSTDFSKKKIQISILMKIRPVAAELFHADGQTDTTKIIVAFRYLSTCLKMEMLCGQTTTKQEELSVLFMRFIRNGISWSEEYSHTCL